MKATDAVILDLLKRDDGMIRLLELLAVLWVISTWHSKLRSRHWQAYINNDGVLFAIINAASREADANRHAGLLWRRLHALATTLAAYRVESKATIGDAGSRIESDEDLYDLKRLNATFVSPGLSSFVNDIWNPRLLLEDSI